MAGSWETSNSVFAYILHVELTTVAWSFGLRNLQMPPHAWAPLTGMPYDMSRNAAAKMCLDGGYEWLFSLDSDVIPPHDAVLRLLAHRQPFISGLYCRRSPPHSVPVCIKNGQWYVNFPRGRVFETDYVGAGCLLIHRSVIENFFQNPQRPGHPVFDWRVHLQGLISPGDALSEDFTLCKAYRERGGKVLVDSSIICRHIGESEYGDGTVAPLNTTPVT